MKRQRAVALVSWDLDPVPGFNDKASDVVAFLRMTLEKAMPWYKPTVTEQVGARVAPETHDSTALVQLAEGVAQPDRGYSQVWTDQVARVYQRLIDANERDDTKGPVHVVTIQLYTRVPR